MLLNTDITVSQLLHYMNGIIQTHPEKEIFEIVDPKVFKSKKLNFRYYEMLVKAQQLPKF